MELVLLLVIVLLLVVIALIAHHARRYKSRYYQVIGQKVPGPIPTTPLSDFHPAFATDEFGPTLRSEVHYVGQAGAVAWGTSDAEAWILAVLAKESTEMFEFGTCTGKTAYLWARNSPAGARVTTLTLAPDQVDRYKVAKEDSRTAAANAALESQFTRFRYSGTEVEGKVTQLFGDSKEFDETPLLAKCDLIFVDGSHAYSYVKSDTEKALRMLKPGGVILWHDYKAWDSASRGVVRFLGELRQRLRLVHLQGTTLVAYRSAERAAEVPQSGAALERQAHV
jgi:hypothetical protein